MVLMRGSDTQEALGGSKREMFERRYLVGTGGMSTRNAKSVCLRFMIHRSP